MSSSTKKIIVVVGATGVQGSSVVRTFLTLPKWHVRAVTRDPSSTASQALANLGAEVVRGDLSSVPTLTEAFKDANAIFVNTDFWGIFKASAAAGKPDPEAAFATEVQHGKNAAIAAAGVPSLERYVYSSLAAYKEISKGKYSQAFHFEAKGAIVDYIENEQADLKKKTSYIYIAAYATLEFLTPRLDEASGRYQIALPLPKDVLFPIIDETTTPGPLVRALIEDEDARVKLVAYDEKLTLKDVAAAWSRVNGKDAIYVEVTPEFAKQKLGLLQPIVDVFGGFTEYGYIGGVQGVIEPSQLKIKWEGKSYEDWLKEQK